ncbi:MAG: hypothetical protein M0R74_12850 [Dehalococcoidia bacterium]|nr:hypothetical protein [Dehalococcoidia bacterium]
MVTWSFRFRDFGVRMVEEMYPGLEIDEDFDFQRRSWVVQRVLWTAGAVVLLAALLGFFGRGVLSSTESSTTEDDVVVSYQRFARLQTPTQIEVTVRVGGDKVEVWIARNYRRGELQRSRSVRTRRSSSGRVPGSSSCPAQGPTPSTAML